VERARALGRVKPTKTAEERLVDLTPELARALQQHMVWLKAEGLRRGRGEPEWLFPNEAGHPFDVKKVATVFHRYRRRAKLRGRPMYQTRHTFATLMLGAGESPAWVAQQLGHTSGLPAVRGFHPQSDAPRRVRGQSLARGTGPVTAPTRGDGDHLVTRDAQGPTGCPVRPRQIGAADRIRTGDVQLGKLAFCH